MKTTAIVKLKTLLYVLSGIPIAALAIAMAHWFSYNKLAVPVSALLLLSYLFLLLHKIPNRTLRVILKIEVLYFICFAIVVIVYASDLSVTSKSGFKRF